MDEDQSLLNVVSLVATSHSLNELPEAPPKSRKIRGFKSPLKDDDQPTSSYRLPVGGASADILAYIDVRILSLSLGMRLKVSKLLQYPGVRSCRFYRPEGVEVKKARSLNPFSATRHDSRHYKKLS